MLGDPCRRRRRLLVGVNLVAGLINYGQPDNDLIITGEGAESMLGALSAAVTQ